MTSLADSSVSIVAVLLKIVGFFVFAGVVGFLFYMAYKKWTEAAPKNLHRHVIIAFVFCLLMAYIAEEVFGVVDITGAFIAGLIISNTQRSMFVETKFDTLSYLLLSPVFFASIGLKVELPKMSGTIVLFSVLLIVVAVLTKIVGCGLGAKLCKYKPYQCKRIGVGMISRGEVALIVASKGESIGLLGTSIFSASDHHGCGNDDYYADSFEDCIEAGTRTAGSEGRRSFKLLRGSSGCARRVVCYGKNL